MCDTFSFPILTCESILSFLNEMIPEIGVKLEDLKRPQQDRITLIFFSVFKLIGVNLDWVHQPLWSVTISIDNPEYYEQAFPFINLLMSMHTFFKEIHADNFYMRDLIDPKPKRTCRFLSALINYYRYTSDKLANYEKIRDEINEIRDKKLYLKQEINSMKNVVNEIVKNKSTRDNMIQCFVEKSQAAEEEYIAVEKKVNDLKSTSNAIKVKNADCNKRNENLKIKIQKQKEENEKLQSKIVKSPDRVKDEVQEATNKHEELCEIKKSQLERLKDLNEQLDRLSITLTDVKHLYDIMTDFGTEQSKHEKMKHDLHTVENKIVLLSQNVKKKDQVLQDIENIFKVKQEKLMKLDMQNKLRFSSEIEQKEELYKKLTEVKANLTQNKIGLSDAKDSMEKVIKEIEKMKEDVKEYEKAIVEATEKVENAFKNYVDNYLSMMNFLTKGLKEGIIQ